MDCEGGFSVALVSSEMCKGQVSWWLVIHYQPTHCVVVIVERKVLRRFYHPPPFNKMKTRTGPEVGSRGRTCPRKQDQD